MNYRICILGNSGSGKSTLAKELGKILKIPVFHLDRELLTGNFEKISTENRIKIHSELINRSQWIIDGNYRKLLLPDRIKRATLVVFLNSSRIRTIPRILLRSRNSGQDIETIPKGASPKQISWQFLKYVVTYNKRKHLNELNTLCAEENTKILALKNQPIQKMVEQVLKTINFCK